MVNLLGERALKRTDERREIPENVGGWSEVLKKGSSSDRRNGVRSGDEGGSAPRAEPHPGIHEHQINDLLSLFPRLQYGMDVNPRFDRGPTGVE